MNRAIHTVVNAFRRILHPNLRETRQLVWIILVLALIAVVAASELPATSSAQNPTAIPTGTALATLQRPTPTSIHAVPDQNETDGMIIGGVVLVLIIVGGTLQVLRPRSNE